jgi:hypothetical protein
MSPVCPDFQAPRETLNYTRDLVSILTNRILSKRYYTIYACFHVWHIYFHPRYTRFQAVYLVTIILMNLSPSLSKLRPCPRIIVKSLCLRAQPYICIFQGFDTRTHSSPLACSRLRHLPHRPCATAFLVARIPSNSPLLPPCYSSMSFSLSLMFQAFAPSPPP